MYDIGNMVYSGQPEGFFRKVFSKLVDKAFHEKVVFSPCFNRKFDSEIKGYGAELEITSEPETIAYPYVRGTPVAPFETTGRARTIKVGRSWQSAKDIKGWLKDSAPEDMKDYFDLKSAEVGEAASRLCETEWYKEGDAELKATAFGSRNSGKQAGPRGNIDLGDPLNPIVLSDDTPEKAAAAGAVNAVDFMLTMNKAYSLAENVDGDKSAFTYAILPAEFRFLVERYQAFNHGNCLPAIADILKKTDVEYKGEAKGFNVLESKRLPSTTKTINGKTYSVYPIFFGDNRAWTWTDLGTRSGTFQSNDTPQLERRWFVGDYDRWLDDPRYFFVAYVALA